MAQETWIVTDPTVIDLEIVRRLKVGLIGGQIDIVGHDEPGARVEVHSVSGRDLKVALEGDTLVIDHPQLKWETFFENFRLFGVKARAEVSILVPRSATLSFNAVSAEGLISGLHSEVTVNTVNGDVVLDGIVGDVSVHAVNGEVSVRGLHGDLTVQTVSGDVTAFGGDSPLHVRRRLGPRGGRPARRARSGAQQHRVGRPDGAARRGSACPVLDQHAERSAAARRRADQRGEGPVLGSLRRVGGVVHRGARQLGVG
ncbi:MAG: hypothetical protein ACJLS2_00555 [Microcella pacifica]